MAIDKHKPSPRYPFASGTRKGPMVPGRPAVAGGPQQGPMVPGPRAHGMAGSPMHGPMVPGPRSYGMAGRLQATHVPSTRPGHPVAGGVPSVRPGHPTGVFAGASGLKMRKVVRAAARRPSKVGRVRTHRGKKMAAGKGGGMAAGYYGGMAGKKGNKKACPPGQSKCLLGPGCGPPCPGGLQQAPGLDTRSQVKLRIAAMRKAKGRKRGRSIAAGGCTRNVNLSPFSCQGAM